MKRPPITAQRLADMEQDEFDALFSSLKTIVKASESPTMSPPRKPRGEKPATTIRLLRRQLHTAQRTIEALQLDRADKEKVIAGYDVQLSEAQDLANSELHQLRSQASRIADLTLKLRENSQRLAFLEGYYAKSQETRPPRRVFTALAPVAGDTAETDARPGSRNQADLSAGRQRSRGAGIEPGPSGFGAGFGEPIRREPVRHSAHQEGRKVEYAKVENDDWRA